MRRSRKMWARSAAVAIAAALVAALVAATLIVAGCTAAPKGAPENRTAPGGSTEATASSTPGGGGTKAPGPEDEAAIKAAVQAYVLGQSEVEAKEYSIENVRMMNDNSGVAWAAVSIVPKSKNLDGASVVLKRGSDGTWVGADMGTSIEGSPAFPPEVSQQFFGPGE